MRYTKIKSKFIKEELKKTKWKNREYVDWLFMIERYVLGDPLDSHFTDRFYKKYPKQLKKIWQELKPKEYKKRAQRRKKEKQRERKDREKFNKWIEAEHKKELREWKKMGGK